MRSAGPSPPIPPISVLRAALAQHVPEQPPRWAGPLLRWATTEAAVVVPLFERSEAWHLLLVEKSRHLRRHAGEVAFPGGRLDPGDAGPWDAALREYVEETGLPRAHLEPLGELSQVPTLTGFRVHVHVARMTEPPARLTPGSGEVARVLAIPVTDFLDGGAATLKIRYWRDRPFPDWRHGATSARVYGATAMMIAELIQVWVGQDVLGRASK